MPKSNFQRGEYVLTSFAKIKCSQKFRIYSTDKKRLHYRRKNKFILEFLSVGNMSPLYIIEATLMFYSFSRQRCIQTIMKVSSKPLVKQ